MSITTLSASQRRRYNDVYSPAFAILELILASRPNADFFHGKNLHFGTAYYAISIAFNIVVTSLIVIRLQKLSKAIGSILGRDSAKVYSGIVSMVIESATPFTLSGVAWIIPYAMGDPTAICYDIISNQFGVCRFYAFFFLLRLTYNSVFSAWLHCSLFCAF